LNLHPIAEHRIAFTSDPNSYTAGEF